MTGKPGPLLAGCCAGPCTLGAPPSRVESRTIDWRSGSQRTGWSATIESEAACAWGLEHEGDNFSDTADNANPGMAGTLALADLAR